MKLKNFGIIIIILVITGTGTTINFAQAKSINSTTSLSALCKVWGLMKYYHPKVISGVHDWDEILIKSVPAFCEITDRETLNQEIVELIRKGGGINFLDFDNSFPNLSLSGHLSFSWIEEDPQLDWYTRLYLKILIQNGVKRNNHYVQYHEFLEIPLFDNEERYSEPEYPSEGVRLLALFRYWNIYNYLSPYRDVIDRDWEEVLTEYIPLVRSASNALEYSFVMRKFTAATDDGHSAFRSRAFNKYWGELYPPFETRYIEEETVIHVVHRRLITNGADIRPGDVIINFEGERTEELWKFTLQYVAGSNIGAKHYNAGFYMFTGDSDTCTLTISRSGIEKKVTLQRYPYTKLYEEEMRTAGPSWSILPGNIGYINMGLLMPEQIEELFTDTEFMNTKGIIFDLRNYPNGTVWEIMKYMVPEPVLTARIKYPVQEKPGDFAMRNSTWFGKYGGNADYYKGKVAILCDERSISQSEYSVMALQKCPDAVTIGSQTAGADGNITRIWLPGNIFTNISGMGIFYPDGSPTQRVGVRIDHTILPTIEGIRQEKDEVLEYAVQLIKNDT